MPLCFELRRETSKAAVVCSTCKYTMILYYFLFQKTPTCVLRFRVHSESESKCPLIVSPYPLALVVAERKPCNSSSSTRYGAGDILYRICGNLDCDVRGL